MSDLYGKGNVSDGDVAVERPPDVPKSTGTMFVACREVSKSETTHNGVRTCAFDSKNHVQEEHEGCECHLELNDATVDDSDSGITVGCCDGVNVSENATDKLSDVDLPPPTPSGTDLPIDIKGITYVGYTDELVLPEITRLMSRDLSEPYSVYTYRYFIHGWPQLTFLAKKNENFVGAIVCKAEDKVNVKRGYIAMLAVHDEYRRRGIGTELVRIAVRTMMTLGCGEVVLETEVSNQAALRLYENLGFMRDKRLFRYYLNGVDALRLKLLLK
jgi:peptide alpha-N-acetyltransferase